MCTSSHGEQVHTTFDCCTEYAQWKKPHPIPTKALQQVADIPCYYKVCDVVVNVHQRARDSLQEEESNKALVNMLENIDIVPTIGYSDVEDSSSHSPTRNKVANSQMAEVRVTTLLKCLQPQRKVPNKSTRNGFAAGDLALSRTLQVPGNDIEKFLVLGTFADIQSIGQCKSFSSWTSYPDT